METSPTNPQEISTLVFSLCVLTAVVGAFVVAAIVWLGWRMFCRDKSRVLESFKIHRVLAVREYSTELAAVLRRGPE
jgi:hypothetical protein